jgi:endonuclease III related protein
MKTGERLLKIYDHLNSRFGHQRWWPAETDEEVVIGAILTQNVAWKNVESALARLKENNLLSLRAIHQTDVLRLAPLIRSSRFFNQKAEKLKTFCRLLFNDYHGSLDAMLALPVASLREQMLSLKGFGEETVDSILLYAGGKPIFVIDAYTKRIFSRAGLAKEDWGYQAFQRLFMDHLPENANLYNDYHAQIVRLGNTLCRKKQPLCEKCPILRFCQFGRAQKEI